MTKIPRPRGGRRIPYNMRMHKMIRARVSRGFTFVCARVSGETVRPRHDLSHPARTKKQIDASSHYNSFPPRPSLRGRAMLYPPGIARQIKHHLLSERVDLDLTAPRASTIGTIFRSQRTRAAVPSILAEYLSSEGRRMRSRARAIQGKRKFVTGEGPPGFLDYASARDSVCTCNHYTRSRGQPLKISGGFTHPFTRSSPAPPPFPSARNSNDVRL